MSRSFLVTLFQHKAWCNQGLVAALRAAPKDVDRRQMVTILLTLEHTSIVDRIFKARLCADNHAFTAVVGTRVPDLDQLGETMRETDAWYIDYVERVPLPELDDIVTFTFVSDGDAGHMTKGQILAHVLTHGASHRGAIGKLMESCGIAGASDMVTTFQRQSESPARRS